MARAWRGRGAGVPCSPWARGPVMYLVRFHPCVGASCVSLSAAADSLQGGGLGPPFAWSHATEKGSMQPYKWCGSSTWTLLSEVASRRRYIIVSAPRRHRGVSPQELRTPSVRRFQVPPGRLRRRTHRSLSTSNPTPYPPFAIAFRPTSISVARIVSQAR